MPRSWPAESLRQGIRRRWDRARRGEYDRETLRSVPSWGLSVLLHAFLLVILAVMIRWSHQAGREMSFHGTIVDTQLGEVTSLVDANQAGDPFTLTNTPDPPSIGLDSDPQLKLAGQPQI